MAAMMRRVSACGRPQLELDRVADPHAHRRRVGDVPEAGRALGPGPHLLGAPQPEGDDRHLRQRGQPGRAPAALQLGLEERRAPAGSCPGAGSPPARRWPAPRPPPSAARRTRVARSTRMPPSARATCPTTGASNTSRLPRNRTARPAPGERGPEGERVEVAAVVGDDDGRPGRGDAVDAVDVEAHPGQQLGAARAACTRRCGSTSSSGSLGTPAGHVEVEHGPAAHGGERQQPRIGVDRHAGGRPRRAAGGRRTSRCRPSCRRAPPRGRRPTGAPPASLPLPHTNSPSMVPS